MLYLQQETVVDGILLEIIKYGRLSADALNFYPFKMVWIMEIWSYLIMSPSWNGILYGS